LTDEFPEKSWTKHGVNKLLKKLRNIGTVDIAAKRNHTPTGSFQSQPHFIKENNYAFECKHINILSMHSYTHRELKAVNLKYNLFVSSSMSAEYLLKFDFLIFQGSVSTSLRVMSYGFCSKFHMLYSSANILKIR